LSKDSAQLVPKDVPQKLRCVNKKCRLELLADALFGLLKFKEHRL
jgi:hypothetical protein